MACVGGKPLDACWLKVARVLTFWGLRGFGGFGAFRGWQTASLDAHKKPWMWPWDACWLRRPGGLGRSNGSGRGVAVACVGGKPLDACWLKVARVLTFWGLRGFGGFGALRGCQTASLDAHKKPWMWPWDACWLRRPGGLGRSNGSGRGVAVACVGKRQAWTPIRSHGCGLGTPVGCEGLAALEEAMDLAVGSLWPALEASLWTPVG